MRLLPFLSAAALLGAGLVPPARAFTPLNGSPVWPDGNIVMHLQLGASPALADGKTWNTAAADMLAEWNQSLVRSRLTWIVDSTAPVGEGNGTNNVIFGADIFGRAFGESTLAVTTVWRVGTRRTEADVIFNTKYRWDSYRGPLRSAPGTNNAEFSRVALHEFGHVIGLGHPDEAGQFISAVMNSRAGDTDVLTADDRDGAAFLYASNTGSVAPRITLPLFDQNPVEGDAVDFSVGVSGTAPFSYQWRRNGVVQGVSTAAWTLSNVALVSSGVWSVTVTNSRGTATSSMVLTVTARPVAPAITRQPASTTARAGQSVTFTVAATGSTPRYFQWRKNGAPLGLATNNDTYTLTEAQLSDAGAYSVEVSNGGGLVTSADAVLTVVAATTPPVFAAAPQSQAIAAGSTVVFHAPAAGDPAPAYQWRRGNAAIPGATSSMFVLRNATATDAGTYSCLATNTAGTATSVTATLSVSASTDAGRLVNLSILTTISATDPVFTVGTVIGGPNTSGTKPLLVRAVGPALTGFGVADFLADPKLELISGAPLVANDNWGTEAGIAEVFARAGAFALANGSRDAALFRPALTPRAYSVQISGVASATGAVLAELFDATPAAAFGASTPRLVNVSVLKPIPADGLLTVGFVIGGTTARTVLVRAMGPALTQFGLDAAQVLADPRLTLFNAASARVAENNNWGGDAQLSAVAESVGAFAPRVASSTDAALLLTLAPGNYTAQVPGTGLGGTALVEVYEVP